MSRTNDADHGPLGEKDRWEGLSVNPYYSVINDEQYRGELTERKRQEFFESGEEHIALIFEDIARHIVAGFSPARSLDFGCGVGRLVLPLARRSGDVIGVDISEIMLREAEHNCAAAGVFNARFLLTRALDEPPAPRDMVDLIHTFITMQHIPPAIAHKVAELLLRRLRPGGIAALHITFSREATPLRKLVHPLRRLFPPLNMLVNVIQGRPAGEPQIPMHNHSRVRFESVFAEQGCRVVHERPTNHGGHIGAILYLRKDS